MVGLHDELDEHVANYLASKKNKYFDDLGCVQQIEAVQAYRENILQHIQNGGRLEEYQNLLNVFAVEQAAITARCGPTEFEFDATRMTPKDLAFWYVHTAHELDEPMRAAFLHYEALEEGKTLRAKKPKSTKVAIGFFRPSQRG